MDVNFVDKGRNVLSCSKDGTAKLWDCGSGACLATLSPESGCINAMNLMESQHAVGNSDAVPDGYYFHFFAYQELDSWIYVQRYIQFIVE